MVRNHVAALRGLICAIGKAHLVLSDTLRGNADGIDEFSMEVDEMLGQFAAIIDSMTGLVENKAEELEKMGNKLAKLLKM